MYIAEFISHISQSYAHIDVQWFLISSFVSKLALLSICQTSPSLHSQVIPVLYHTIDLSTHAPPDGVTISFRYRRMTYERQYMFKRQISLKPEYGQYVRSLKWTVGLENEQVWSVFVGLNDSRLPQRLVWRSTDVGKLFEALNQVVNLDIEWPNRSGEMISGTDGKMLFPAVQRVNLVSRLSLLATGMETDAPRNRAVPQMYQPFSPE